MTDIDLKSAVPITQREDGTLDTDTNFEITSAMPLDINSAGKTWAILSGDKSPEEAFDRGLETAKAKIRDVITELPGAFDQVFTKPVKDIFHAETSVAFPPITFMNFVRGVIGADEVTIDKPSDAFKKFPIGAGLRAVVTGQAPNAAESLVKNFHVTNPYVADMIAGIATIAEAEIYFGALSTMGEIIPKTVQSLKTSWINATTRMGNKVIAAAKEGYAFQHPEWTPEVVEKASLDFFRKLTKKGVDGVKVNAENPFSLMRSVNDVRGGFGLKIIKPEILYSDLTGAGFVLNLKEMKLIKEIAAGAKLELEPKTLKKIATALGLKAIDTREAMKHMELLGVKPPKLSPKEVTPIVEGGGTPSPQGKERGFVSSVKGEMPQLEKVAGQYIPRSTDELAIKARTLIKEDLKTAQDMALKGTDDASIATGAELLKYYVDQAESATGLAKDAIYEKATELANSMAERLTELGRSVQAASILTRLTPEGQLRFAAKTIQKYNEKMKAVGKLEKMIPELTPEQSKDIIDSMLIIDKMSEGEAKAIAFRDLQNKISDLVPTPLMDKIIAVWKAGLLTGLKTSGLNILSNAAHAATLIASDMPSALIDMAVSIKTGKRSVVFNVQGYGKGFKEGMEKGKRFLKTGYDERDVLSKLDYKRVNMGKSKFAKAIQKYEEFIFKIMGTEDQPFYYGAKLRSLYGQAKVEALNKGLKGAERDAFIINLVENPTDDMVLLAVEDAKIAVYQNDTVLGTLAKHIQNTPGGVGQFILPFGRTPSAVATQIVNYTPAAAVKVAWQNYGKNFNQRDFSEGMGKALGTGTAVLGFGYWLYKQGLMTGERPTDEATQKLWEMEGRTANSIKIGGAWRTIQSLGPIGNVLLIAGSFAKAYEDTGTITGTLAQGTFGAMKSFTEQTFLKGVSGFLEAINDPKRNAASFINSFIGSAVPTIVKDVGVSTDVKARRAQGPVEAVIERLPVLRYMLEPKVDTFGRDIERTNNFLQSMADPTRPSKIKNDPVVIEIRRLVDAKQEVHTGQLGKRLGYTSLTPKQNTELWHKAGQDAYERISMLMQSYESSESLTDERKAEKINKIINDANDRARLDIILEATAGLEDEALINKLKLMKKENLLNETIYKKYMRLR